MNNAPFTVRQTLKASILTTNQMSLLYKTKFWRKVIVYKSHPYSVSLSASFSTSWKRLLISFRSFDLCTAISFYGRNTGGVLYWDQFNLIDSTVSLTCWFSKEQISWLIMVASSNSLFNSNANLKMQIHLCITEKHHSNSKCISYNCIFINSNFIFSV